MKTRTKEAIILNPPSEIGIWMCKAQFGIAKYSDIAFCINTRIDAGGDYCVVEVYDEDIRIKQK